MKDSIAGLSSDKRLQLVLIAFCFGAFLEGTGGGGAPVAIAGAFLMGFGFSPFQSATLCLLANTAPVAWDGVGNPSRTLGGVTGLPEFQFSAMAGRILPPLSLILPFWLVRSMVGWRETFQVWPALLVSGLSFAGMQFYWSNYQDIAGSKALFGNLQKVTAEQLSLSPILMGAANSTGGVMGKMIDAQSIVVASSATNQQGQEAAIFKAVFWHSIALACLFASIVMFYAYVVPWAVPR